MRRRQLFAGCLLDFSRHDHVIGGENKSDGAECPNCRRALLLHLTLNLNDPLIKITSYPFPQLRLFYCMRCALSWQDFCYKITAENKIEIVKANAGEVNREDWIRIIGFDQIPERSIGFKNILPRHQELFDKIESKIALGQNEKIELEMFATGRIDIDASDYIMIRPIIQIGGRTYLCQEIPDPFCHTCGLKGRKMRMLFLASLVNDQNNGLRFTYDDYQIVFFFCPLCLTVHVQHSVC